MNVRFFQILFWLFVSSLILAMAQNFFLGQSILSNDVFILMGICVVQVLCDEITRHLNNSKKIREEIEKEYEQERRNKEQFARTMNKGKEE